jgi:hypothetical protein
MRRKKWLWLGFAALCAFTLAIGWPSRPEDELVGLRALHPRETTVLRPDGNTALHFEFNTTPQVVIDHLRLPKGLALSDFVVPYAQFRRTVPHTLPSGRTLELWVRYPGVCVVEVPFGEPDPWYTQAWLTLKHCLGLG